MKQLNPFLVTGYISPEYFCDRENETSKILNAIKNRRNLTLFSLRRMGKTGLINHIIYKLAKQKEISSFYLDIQDTSNIKEFTHEFAKAVIGKFDSFSSKVIQNIGRTFSNLRPTISYDSLTGEPKINLDIANENDAIKSLEQIFEYLGKQKTNILVAIDEFQQILNYPDKNVEALLRKNIQKNNNVNFIFAGSHKHMLISMFRDHSRPFYQSSELMNLGTISREKYKKFIIKKLLKSEIIINDVDVDYILDWTKVHTYYVQFICNRLFSLGINEISHEIIKQTMGDILLENRVVYNNYRNLLSTNQWNLLKAIAKEKGIKQITSSKFIGDYKLGTPSSVSSSLKVLLDKEMVYRTDDLYEVNDLFLSRWLEAK